MLGVRGFLKYTLEYFASLGRWRCEIEDHAFCPAFNGEAKGWGFTPKEAALNALGCQPINATQAYERALRRGVPPLEAAKQYAKDIKK